MTISIVEKKQTGFFEQKWWPLERYRLTIDRTGEILDMKVMPLAQGEIYIDPLEHFWQISPGNIDSSIKSKLNISEVKKPVGKITDKGLNVQVEFLVENPGKARRVYPYVEYDVAQLRFGKYETTTIRSPSSWQVELQPRSITPIVFEATLDATSIVLTDPPHQVKAKLFKKAR